MASCNEADRTLTCSVCLETFDQPKFLKCFHSVCERRCAQKLLQESNGIFTIKCPQCYEITPVPNGDVCTLQTNFYITFTLEQRKREVKCALHPADTLCFVCVDCQVAICNKCLLKEHLRHAVRDLAEELAERKRELGGCQSRLNKAVEQLESHLTRLENNTKSADDEKRNVEILLRERATKINDMVKEELDKALASLDEVSLGLQWSLYGHVFDVEQRLSAARSLQQELKHVLGGAVTPALLDVTRMMREGKSSPQALHQLTSDLPVGDERIVFSFDDTSLSRTAIRQFLGHTQSDKTKRPKHAATKQMQELGPPGPGERRAPAPWPADGQFVGHTQEDKTA